LRLPPDALRASACRAEPEIPDVTQLGAPGLARGRRDVGHHRRTRLAAHVPRREDEETVLIGALLPGTVDDRRTLLRRAGRSANQPKGEQQTVNPKAS